jgi:hypothetical protein
MDMENFESNIEYRISNIFVFAGFFAKWIFDLENFESNIEYRISNIFVFGRPESVAVTIFGDSVSHSHVELI